MKIKPPLEKLKNWLNWIFRPFKFLWGLVIKVFLWMNEYRLLCLVIAFLLGSFVLMPIVGKAFVNNTNNHWEIFICMLKDYPTAALAIGSLPIAFVLWLFRNHDIVKNLDLAKYHEAVKNIHDKKASVGLRQVAFATFSELEKKPMWKNEIKTLNAKVFQEANLKELNLQNDVLNGNILQGANKQGANLQKANLKDAHLQGAKLTIAKLQGADLTGANLQNAELIKAELQDAHLDEADLRGADLYKTNLKGAHLDGADLRGVDLRNTNLQVVESLSGADLRGADLRGNNLQGASLHDAILQDADLRGADLTGASLAMANLWKAKLQGADLRNARLGGYSGISRSADLGISSMISYAIAYYYKNEEMQKKEEMLRIKNIPPGTSTTERRRLLKQINSLPNHMMHEGPKERTREPVTKKWLKDKDALHVDTIEGIPEE